MRTMDQDLDLQDLDLREIGRAAWRELPLMLTISLLVTLACGATASVAMVVAPLAPLAAALTLGPVWMAAVALAAALLDGQAVGIRDLATAIGRWGATGIAISLVPATLATLLIGSVGVLSANPDQRWLLAPIALDGTALVVAALACFAVFPLAVAADQTQRDRWLAACALAGLDLRTTLGVTAVPVLMALSTRVVGPFVALLLPGPLALLCTAATRHAGGRAMSRGIS